MRIRVLIVDDHALMRAGIRRLLVGADLDCSLEARSGEELLRLCQEGAAFDVIVLDYDLPDIQSARLIAEIRKFKALARIVLLMPSVSMHVIQPLLKLGVTAIVTKADTSAEALRDAVRAAATGKTYYSAPVQDILLRVVNGDDRKISPRELEVMELVVRGLRSSEIAERLGVTTTTVRTFRKTLMRKLDVSNTAGMIQAAIERGFLQRHGTGIIFLSPATEKGAN